MSCWRYECALRVSTTNVAFSQRWMATHSDCLAAAWITDLNICCWTTDQPSGSCTAIGLLQSGSVVCPLDVPACGDSHDRAFLDATTNRKPFFCAPNSHGCFNFPLRRGARHWMTRMCLHERRFVNDSVTKGTLVYANKLRSENIGYQFPGCLTCLYLPNQVGTSHNVAARHRKLLATKACLIQGPQAQAISKAGQREPVAPMQKRLV